MFLFVGAAHWAARERSDEDTGPYVKNTAVSISAVGAGALTRPPSLSAELEPHQPKRRASNR